MWTEDQARQNGSEFKLLIIRKIVDKLPGSLLGKLFTFLHRIALTLVGPVLYGIVCFFHVFAIHNGSHG